MRAGQLVTAFVRGRHFQEALSEAVELVGGGAQVLVAARPVADDAHLFVHTRMQRSWPSSFFAASDMIAPSPRLSTTRLNDARKEAHGVAGPARKGSPNRRRCASLASFLWRFTRAAASGAGAFGLSIASVAMVRTGGGARAMVRTGGGARAMVRTGGGARAWRPSSGASRAPPLPPSAPSIATNKIAGD